MRAYPRSDAWFWLSVRIIGDLHVVWVIHTYFDEQDDRGWQRRSILLTHHHCFVDQIFPTVEAVTL